MAIKAWEYAVVIFHIYRPPVSVTIITNEFAIGVQYANIWGANGGIGDCLLMVIVNIKQTIKLKTNNHQKNPNIPKQFSKNV